MKQLQLLSIAFGCFFTAFAQESPTYLAEFSCKKFMVNAVVLSEVTFEEGITDKIDSATVVQSLLSRFYYTFLAETRSYNNKAFVTQKNFKGSGGSISFGFDSISLFIENNKLYRKEGSAVTSAGDEKFKNIKEYKPDSLIYTAQKTTVNGYECIVAHSSKGITTLYYISTELPITINPGLSIANPKGAVLGMKSPHMEAILTSLRQLPSKSTK